MNATIYKFSKDPRSTARPSGGASITGIVFKNDTSRENPVLKITADALSSDYDWNYIHIMGHYYYINDIVFLNNDIWELHCTIDPLATWKTEIEASTQYVVRTTNANFKNGFINDTAYPMTNDVDTEQTTAAGSGSSGWFTNTFGCAVIGVLGPNAGDTTTYYEMATGTLTTLIGTLYGIDVTQQFSIASIEIGLLKTLYDPIKYMTSCILLPYTFPSTGGGDTNIIKCGYLDLPIPANNPVNRIQSIAQRVFTAEIDYSNHPQAGTRGEYLNNGPYTQRVLQVMPFGTFNLDCSKLNDYQNKLRLTIHCNKSDGNAILEAYTLPTGNANVRNTLFMSNAQMGVHIPLYQSDSIFKQTYSLMGAQVGTVGSVLSGNFMNLPNLAMQWCGSVNSAHSPEVHMVGGSSGSFILSDKYDPQIDSSFYHIVPEDNNMGHMLCNNYTLGIIHGLNICQNAKIDIPAPSEEIENIKNVMNTGIIIP